MSWQYWRIGDKLWQLTGILPTFCLLRNVFFYFNNHKKNETSAEGLPLNLQQNSECLISTYAQLF